MSPPDLFAIIVLYRQRPEECSSLQTLLRAHEAFPQQRLVILVADNTPGGQDIEELPAGVRYRAYPENPGLAAPYNDALTVAHAEGFPWLLTLDQDTHLPESFLAAMAAHMARYESASQIAAIVPRIVDGGRLISPFRFAGGFLPLVLPATTQGILPPHASALNSASVLRVGALQQVGGYDPRFPLHNSDTRLYLKLDYAGLRVAVADDVVVSHELAILDRAGRMSPERYRRTLRDECFFWDRHMGAAARCERMVRLAGRVCKGLLQREASVYRRIAVEEIIRRLFTTRRKRLATLGEQGADVRTVG